MIVGTTETAKILNISTGRLRILLIAGRVEGAYKTGKMWLIPLFNGRPIITKRKRGPAPRWSNPRKPAKTVVHVNAQRIRQNQKNSLKQPVITVKRRNNNQYGHEVEIPGGCRVVYRPDSPMCGARVWIESLHELTLRRPRRTGIPPSQGSSKTYPFRGCLATIAHGGDPQQRL